MEAVIYVRVSNDTSGIGRSIGEQEAECRATAAEHGWEVREVVADNSVGASRWSSKQIRPGFERLKSVLQQGDVLMIWEASRAHRKLEDHIVLRDLCESRGVLLCVGGDLIDFSKTADRSRAAQEAVAAEAEAGRTRERIRRNVTARAKSGAPHSGLPFGYRRRFDPATGVPVWEVDPVAAPLVRDAVAKLLAGRSLNSIAGEWNDAGIVTGQGKPWYGKTVRQFLRRPSLAGLRQFRGSVLGPGDWEPIISVDEHQRILAVLADPARVKYRGNRSNHLLTSIARCGVCSDVIRYQTHHDKQDQYRCVNGCVGRQAEPTNEMVVAELLRLINLWRANVFLFADENRAATGESSKHWQEAVALKQRLDAITDQAIEGTISAEQLARATERLTPQIEAATEKARSEYTHPLLVRIGESSNSIFNSWTIEEKRELIRVTLAVTILKTKQGRRTFDPDTVSVEWIGSPLLPPDNARF